MTAEPAIDARRYRDTIGRFATGVTVLTWDDGEPTIGRVFSDRLEAHLGPARRADEPVGPRHEAIAASLQVVFEDAAFHEIGRAHV